MFLAIFVILVVLFIVLPLAGLALWTIVSALVVGLIFGGLGRLIIPGRQPIGLLATAVIGWIGALVGGLIGRGLFGLHHHWATLVIEIVLSAVGVGAYSNHQRKAVSSGSSHRVLDI